MENLIKELSQGSELQIGDKKYRVKTKTFYTIEEDRNMSYIKCELSENKALVIMPTDNYM